MAKDFSVGEEVRIDETEAAYYAVIRRNKLYDYLVKNSIGLASIERANLIKIKEVISGNKVGVVTGKYNSLYVFVQFPKWILSVPDWMLVKARDNCGK